jgi:hypothetical protein
MSKHIGVVVQDLETRRFLVQILRPCVPGPPGQDYEFPPKNVLLTYTF